MTQYEIKYSGLVEPFFNNPYFKIPIPISITEPCILTELEVNWAAKKLLIQINDQEKGNPSDTLVDILDGLTISIHNLDGTALTTIIKPTIIISFKITMTPPLFNKHTVAYSVTDLLDIEKNSVVNYRALS